MNEYFTCCSGKLEWNGGAGRHGPEHSEGASPTHKTKRNVTKRNEQKKIETTKQQQQQKNKRIADGTDQRYHYQTLSRQSEDHRRPALSDGRLVMGRRWSRLVSRFFHWAGREPTGDGRMRGDALFSLIISIHTLAGAASRTGQTMGRAYSTSQFPATHTSSRNTYVLPSFLSSLSTFSPARQTLIESGFFKFSFYYSQTMRLEYSRCQLFNERFPLSSFVFKSHFISFFKGLFNEIRNAASGYDWL